MNTFFRYKPSTPGEDTFSGTIKKELTASHVIPKHSWFKVNFMSFFRSENKRYKRMLVKSTTRMDKELDLQKFLHRQRILVTSLLGLLRGRQSSFVDYHRQLVVRESTDMENTSSDAELDDWS